MSAAATETICRGDTSMYSTRSGGVRVASLRCRHVTRSSMNRARLVERRIGWAMTYCPSSIADRYSISSVTRPPATFRYGVSMKPYSLVLA